MLPVVARSLLADPAGHGPGPGYSGLLRDGLECDRATPLNAALGEEGGTRSWDDARTFGFVSAGGGKWFSQGLRRPQPGHRINVYIPKVGYVGIGEVCGERAPFADAMVGDGSVRLAEQQLVGSYRHQGDENDPDVAEYVFPVRRLKTVDRADAVTAKGIFALQLPICRLTNAATLAVLNTEFFPEQAGR
ncbi:hypothetical protein [Embleya sp. NPDC005971]|uniref:hypothetical protein n=1 Tax=Embleya sp. NPDC005971 TaxID=3156724 RepID=UPI0034035F61